MAQAAPPVVAEGDLMRWKLVADFRERLAEVCQGRSPHPTWEDPARLLQMADYLSLYLFGLFNPVVRTMQGLCAASHLPRVQEDICRRPVSPGSFSEAQHVLDPTLLPEIFAGLQQEVQQPGSAGAGERRWLLQDGSLFEALPRMYWALWRRQGKAQSQVRLHLSLDLASRSPARVAVTPGKSCERAAWRRQWQRGDGFVGDRYFGENYKLFGEMEAQGVVFVVRLRDEAVINVAEELPLTEADRQAKVIRAAWATLGGQSQYRSLPLRVVWVQTDKEVLRLVTNLPVAELSHGEVALLYKERWQIELFFRWIKCILGCRHWLAESPEGAALQIYLALIAALLLQLYTGERPNRRLMELLQFYTLGIATLADLEAGLRRELARQEKKLKKS